MNYLFILNLILIGLLIFREIRHEKVVSDLILHIKSQTSVEFAEAKTELKNRQEEPEEEPEEVPLGDLENEKFQELVNKE